MPVDIPVPNHASGLIPGVAGLNEFALKSRAQGAHCYWRYVGGGHVPLLSAGPRPRMTLRLTGRDFSALDDRQAG